MESNLKWSIEHLIPRVVNHIMCKAGFKHCYLMCFIFLLMGLCESARFSSFHSSSLLQIITQTFHLAKVPQQKFMLLLAQWSIFIFFEKAVRGPVWIAKLAILWNERLFSPRYLSLKSEKLNSFSLVFILASDSSQYYSHSLSTLSKDSLKLAYVSWAL